jgi:predicted nucleic acid-binding protein
VTRFTLDSNVLVYAIDRNDQDRFESALKILALAARRDCMLIPQTLAEFFSVVTRKRLATRELATAQLQDWLDAYPVASGPTARCVLDAARAPLDFRFYDALLLATAAAAGCTAIISEDMRPGALLNGARVVAAFDAAGGIGAEALALLGG